MKKLFCVLVVFILMLSSFACAEDTTDVEVTTIQTWLETKGECQPCRVRVMVLEVINPVLALVGDDTGTVNLFGVTVNGEFTDFSTLDLQNGEVLVLENPVYNEYEGNIEMAESMLVERIPVERNTDFSLGNTTWSMSAHYRNGSAVDIESGSLTLNEDGTGHLISNVQDYDLTWSLDGNEIVLNVQEQIIRLQLCLVWNEEDTTQVYSAAE